jgi:hypothetical protein
MNLLRSGSILYQDPDLGRIAAPLVMEQLISLPGRPVRHQHAPGEIGVFVMKHKRPVWGEPINWSDPRLTRCDNCHHTALEHQVETPVFFLAHCICGCRDFANRELLRYDLITHSITHNERVDEGAVIQDINMFGTPSTAFINIAIANGVLTKTKTDLSLGVITNHATTNEYTASGLTRAAGGLSTYTAPASLGATFSRIITKLMTATASVTAYGAGLFDNVTPASSNLYVEDNYASNAVLVNGDTLTTNVTITN